MSLGVFAAVRERLSPAVGSWGVSDCIVPLAAGAASLMFEGAPNYPRPDRFWEVAEKHRVTIFYTAPTAIRAIMREGDDWVRKHDLSSVRLPGSVGEPINPEAWMWYHEVVSRGRCPIVDTWWQTEADPAVVQELVEGRR